MEEQQSNNFMILFQYLTYLVQYNWWSYTDPNPLYLQYIILQFHAQRNFLGVLCIYRWRAESSPAPDIAPPTQELSNLTQFYASNSQFTHVFPKFNPD